MIIETIKYDEFLKKVETGDLFFTASRNPLSFGIRVATAGKVSHVGGFFWDKMSNGDEYLFIHEANVGKIFSPQLARHRLREEPFFYWARLPDEICEYSAEEGLDRAKWLYSAKYSKLEAFLSPFFNIDMFTQDKRNIKTNTELFKDLDPKKDKYFCSEVQAKIRGVMPVLSFKDITPIDLIQRCKLVYKVVFE